MEEGVPVFRYGVMRRSGHMQGMGTWKIKVIIGCRKLKVGEGNQKMKMGL